MEALLYTRRKDITKKMSQSGDITIRPDSDELAFFDIVIMLLRHRWLILLTVLFCFAVGIFLARGPRQYAANSMLRVQPGVSGQYRASQPGTSSLEVADQTSPYVDILQSNTLLLRVAKDLDLANNPDFLGSRPLHHQSLDDDAVKEQILRSMHGRIVVTHKAKDEIIRIVCTTPNNKLSANIANTLINDFVVYLVQVRYGASKRSSGWLLGQLDDLKQQVERDQTDLTGLQAKLGIVGLSETGSDYLSAQALDALTKASSAATVDRIVAEAKYRFLNESDPSLIEGEVNLLGGSAAAPGSLLQSLRSAQGTQASTYAKLLEQFGSKYPTVQQAKAQLDETSRQVIAEQKRIVNQARLSFSAAAANESMTNKTLNDKQSESFGQRSDMVKYVILLHDYQSHRTLYEGLITRLQEAGITAGLESGEVDIVDLADVPTRPAPPGRLTYLAGSLAAGVILGCILALLAEALNTRVITSDQAGRVSLLPPLAILPRLSKGDLTGSISRDSPYIEAIETLRTSLIHGEHTPSLKVLLLTSALANEGKSTISASLAVVLAQHGTRVLLIDCDLRHGNLASQFGLASNTGLTSVLEGKADLDSALQTVTVVPGIQLSSGLQVLVSGPSVSTRAALILGSNQMQTLIESARERFDFVILNGPPALGLSDVLNIGKLSDTVLFIIRSKAVTRKSVKQALQALEIARLPLLGYVLNDFRPEVRESGYKTYRGTTPVDVKGAA